MWHSLSGADWACEAPPEVVRSFGERAVLLLPGGEINGLPAGDAVSHNVQVSLWGQSSPVGFMVSCGIKINPWVR